MGKCCFSFLMNATMWWKSSLCFLFVRWAVADKCFINIFISLWLKSSKSEPTSFIALCWSLLNHRPTIYKTMNGEPLWSTADSFMYYTQCFIYWRLYEKIVVTIVTQQTDVTFLPLVSSACIILADQLWHKETGSQTPHCGKICLDRHIMYRASNTFSVFWILCPHFMPFRESRDPLTQSCDGGYC